MFLSRWIAANNKERQKNRKALRKERNTTQDMELSVMYIENMERLASRRRGLIFIDKLLTTITVILLISISN